MAPSSAPPAVAGVPRSGLLPALHLALHRNVPLLSLDRIMNGGRACLSEADRAQVFGGTAANADGNRKAGGC